MLRLTLLCVLAVPPAAFGQVDWLTTTAPIGVSGGRLVTALRAEPRTFNPVTAVDGPSREIIRRLHADLVTIDRATQRTTVALARSLESSADGRRLTLHLRRGLRFSDGHAFDADDVVFSFALYLDPQIDSPQRSLLVLDGRVPTVTKRDRWTVELSFEAPYGPGDRIFDSVAMLPRHLLEADYRAGTLARSWGTSVDPARVAGLGPFRLRAYQPGQAIVLERNPYYWKRDARGTALPYLDELRFVFAPNEDAQALRLEAGDLDVVDRMGAEQFQRLLGSAAQTLDLRDLGPGLDYTFLLFNLNDLPATASVALRARQRWFLDGVFRQAVSLAVDRRAVARLAYASKATPVWWQVSGGNQFWYNRDLPRPERSVAEARRLLKAGGYTWSAAGALVDQAGRPVSFSILTSSSNTQRSQTLTLLQADLKDLGIEASIVALEFGALVERVMRSHDYDAAIMAVGSGDVDPGGQLNVWKSTGATHLWRLVGEPRPVDREIDALMDAQMRTADVGARRAAYARVQALVASDLPIIPLVAPHVLLAAKRGIANLRPGIIDHHLLWNVDELFWRPEPR